ncbi:nucleoside transporter-domain-containing protein [Syncephalis fuscata]|nr:nucleoside transporter-domain-containing protein [Syncephalis fuscata]
MTLSFHKAGQGSMPLFSDNLPVSSSAQPTNYNVNNNQALDIQNTANTSCSYLRLTPLLGISHHTTLDAAASKKVYTSFVLLGFLALLPWCMFINAFEYFRIRFIDSAFAENYASYISTGYTISSVISMILAVNYQHRANKRRDIIISSVIITGVFALVAIITRLETLDSNICFYLIFSTAVVSSMASGFLQIYSFAIVPWFPLINTQGILNGQAIAGILPSAIQIISAASGVQNGADEGGYSPSVRTFIVFLFAVISGVVVINDFLQFSDSEIYHSCVVDDTITAVRQDNTTNGSEIVADDSSANSGFESTNKDSLLRVIIKIRLPALSILTLFIITLAVFPAITARIIPTGEISQYHRELFVAVHFAVFNFGDWFGRMIPAFYHLETLRNNAHLLTAVLLRVGFVVFFLLSNVQSPIRWYEPLFLNSFLFFAVLFIFAATNGWFASISFMNAPELVRKVNRPLASSVMSLLLVVGLASGSALSFLMQGIVCGCNPFINK